MGNEPLLTLDMPTIKTYHAYRIALKNYPHHHMVFALDPDKGRSVWLGRKKALGAGFAAKEAITNCQKKAVDIHCRILDLDGDIIWVGIDENLKKKLMKAPDYSLELTATPYSKSVFRVSEYQLQKFEQYRSKLLPRDSSAFYVGIDGSSTGVAYSTGRKISSRSNVLRDAEIRCRINSDGKSCYLFGLNGKAANKDVVSVTH